MTHTRIIIPAAGPQKYWNHHLNVPSHMVPCADGVPLLIRTITQAAQCSNDVHVLTPDDSQDYDLSGGINGAIAMAPECVITWNAVPSTQTNEYRTSEPFWNLDGRTVLLLGDVYFTPRAVTTVMQDANVSYRVFGRYGKSALTGTPYGEIFAASWHSGHHGMIREHLTRIEHTYATQQSRRQDGWTLLRSIQGTDLNKHRIDRNYFVEINDLTDDIDKVDDYLRHPAFGGGR